jgi:hypothetical protein
MICRMSLAILQAALVFSCRDDRGPEIGSASRAVTGPEVAPIEIRGASNDGISHVSFRHDVGSASSASSTSSTTGTGGIGGAPCDTTSDTSTTTSTGGIGGMDGTGGVPCDVTTSRTGGS